MVEPLRQDGTPSSAIAQGSHREIPKAPDCSFGTIWRVAEVIWKAYLRQYDRRSIRKWHPGVSLQLRRDAGQHEMVPLIHGSSRSGGPVVVRDLSAGKEPGHATYFGKIVGPVRLPLHYFDKQDQVTNVNKPRKGPWWLQYQARRNEHKPRLDGEEMVKLLDWAADKKLIRATM